jgi:hypothetical protein
MDIMPDEATVPSQKRLMIYFQRSDDVEKDQRRLRRIHGLLTQHPGNDRFTIILENEEGSFEFEFPNDTTQCSDELLTALKGVVGEENVEFFDYP